MDIDELATRLSALPPLRFRRRLQPDAASTYSTSSTPAQSADLIYGSVTLHDIVKHLEKKHGLSLVAPDAILAFKDGQDRLRRKGEEVVHVNLKNGKSVPLTVEVLNAE